MSTKYVYIDGSLHARIQFVILGYRGAFEYRNVDQMTSAMPRIALALKLWSSLEKSVVATAQLHIEMDTAKHLSTIPA